MRAIVRGDVARFFKIYWSKKMRVYCSECRKEAVAVQRDFGIGAYEYWGATGFDSCIMTVSECCDGDLLTQEQLDELNEEEKKDE